MCSRLNDRKSVCIFAFIFILWERKKNTRETHEKKNSNVAFSLQNDESEKMTRWENEIGIWIVRTVMGEGQKETAHLKTTQIIETKWMYTVSVVMFFEKKMKKKIINSFF